MGALLVVGTAALLLAGQRDTVVTAALVAAGTGVVACAGQRARRALGRQPLRDAEPWPGRDPYRAP